MKTKVESVELLHCGYCTYDISFLYNGVSRGDRKFPANVVLIKHSDLGYILYDTGYSDEIHKGNGKSIVYNRLMRPVISEEDTIIYQLATRGIDTDDIKHIVISHLHPDHVGGLKFFRNSTIHTSLDVIRTASDNNLKDMVFQNMLGDTKNWVSLRERSNSWLSMYFDCYDIFGDESIVGVILSGHADGQVGLFIPECNVLFGADSCWGIDLLNKNLKTLPSKLQHNYRVYMLNNSLLQRLCKDREDIRVIFSHDNISFNRINKEC